MVKKEIELKFLVKRSRLHDIVSNSEYRLHIIQGYLFGSVHTRVRTVVMEGDSNKAFITIKGDRDGICRNEFEYEIPYVEGILLLDKFSLSSIIKTRYIIKHAKNIWEVDDFHGRNAGLIIAEIEIPRVDYDVEMPEWLEEWVDIVDINKYYNYQLSKFPYAEWLDKQEKWTNQKDKYGQNRNRTKS